MVNHAVGYLLVGLHRRAGFGVGGRHIWFVYSGGAISLTAIGRSHFWGSAAKLNCVHAHCLCGLWQYQYCSWEESHLTIWDGLGG